MKITRRQLAASAAGLVSSSLWSRLAQARGAGLTVRDAADDPHFFLFVQVYGAWDVCLAFDPKDREALLPDGQRAFDQPYAIDAVREFGGMPLAPDGQVLGKYADRLAIINGIDMEADNGHTPDAMMTGRQNARQASAPYVQTILAKRHPFLKRRAVPHLYAAYDGQLIVGANGSTTIMAAPGDFMAFLGTSGRSGDDSSVGDGDLATLRSMLVDYRSGLPSPGSRRVFGAYVEGVEDAISVGTALRDYGYQAPADVDVPDGLGSFLGQLFAAGILGSATLSFGMKYSFDTHSDHYATHPLGRALADLDAVCAKLKTIRLDDRHSVFDRTTVILTGEYARTARLNSASGKDHNFRTNSFVAFGHGVRPGVFGASGTRSEGEAIEAHAGLPVDLASGRPSDGGTILHAANVWAGLGSMVDVDLSAEFGADVAPIRFFD